MYPPEESLTLNPLIVQFKIKLKTRCVFFGGVTFFGDLKLFLTQFWDVYSKEKKDDAFYELNTFKTFYGTLKINMASNTDPVPSESTRYL